jgi:hypothetical protein
VSGAEQLLKFLKLNISPAFPQGRPFKPLFSTLFNTLFLFLPAYAILIPPFLARSHTRHCHLPGFRRARQRDHS